MNHAELPLDAFWISIMQEYPSVESHQSIVAVFYIPLV